MNKVLVKIQKVRNVLAHEKLNKSGLNKFSNFKYFTLDDFLPKLTDLCEKNGLCPVFSIDLDEFGQDRANLTIYDVDSDDKIKFSSPIASVDIKGATAIQALGGMHTYMRRYLYLNAFDIVEPELLDEIAGSEVIDSKPYKAEKPKQEKKPFVPFDKDLLAQIGELKIDLMKYAAYIKKDFTELTNEDLQNAIDKKRNAQGGNK